MAEYRTTLTGAFPRPEALVQATRDLDRARISPEESEAAFVRAEEEVRRLEQELRFDAVTGGYLRWPDLFRPFAAIWSGVRAGALSRFFETNTFFRQPVLDAAPQRGGGGLASWLPRGPGARGILPGPYTFAALADLRYAPASTEGAIVDIALALAEEIRALGPDRPEHLQFQEPMLAVDPPKGEPRALVEAYRHLADASMGSRTSVWTYFGDIGPALSTAALLPVEAIGFDLFESQLPPGASLGGKAMGVGCIDPRTTLAEEPAAVVRQVRAAEEVLRPPVVWLGPSPPLDLLPYDAAVAKLGLLPMLREELAR